MEKKNSVVLKYKHQKYHFFLFSSSNRWWKTQLSIYLVSANGCCKLLTCVQSDDATSLAGERLQLRHQPISEPEFRHQPISDETELRRQPISEPDFCHQPISNATGRGTKQPWSSATSAQKQITGGYICCFFSLFLLSNILKVPAKTYFMALPP